MAVKTDLDRSVGAVPVKSGGNIRIIGSIAAGVVFGALGLFMVNNHKDAVAETLYVCDNMDMIARANGESKIFPVPSSYVLSDTTLNIVKFGGTEFTQRFQLKNMVQTSLDDYHIKINGITVLLRGDSLSLMDDDNIYSAQDCNGFK